MNKTTKSAIHYEVRLAGSNSTFSASGYKGFHQRLSKIMKGKIRGNVYGLQQAREHIKQLRRHVYQGERIYAKSQFEILKITTTTKVLPA